MTGAATITRALVLQEARSWLGTPFHHQGRLKGVGVDCAGLVIGVAGALGLTAFDTRGYGRQPDSEDMLDMCRAQMRPITPEEVRPGDVWLIEIDGRPQHLAFATDIGLLHAYAPSRRVVEHCLDATWAALLRGAFALPGII